MRLATPLGINDAIHINRLIFSADFTPVVSNANLLADLNKDVRNSYAS